jgi:hypothetical protein
MKRRIDEASTEEFGFGSCAPLLCAISYLLIFIRDFEQPSFFGIRGWSARAIGCG